MRTLIFGNECDQTEILKTLESMSDDLRPVLHIDYFNNYDDLRKELVDDKYELVIILANGAQGMEACIGTRKICPEIPLFWFSDDPYFGPQSYRLDCTYFSTKPLTASRLNLAFELLRDDVPGFGFESYGDTAMIS